MNDTRHNTGPGETEEKLLTAVLWLNSKALGLVCGMMCGLAIFVATNWLLIKGGHVTPEGLYVVGPNLQLLSQIFPGYRVSFVGSLIGGTYGFLVGALGGTLLAWIYNSIVYFRSKQ